MRLRQTFGMLFASAIAAASFASASFSFRKYKFTKWVFFSVLLCGMETSAINANTIDREYPGTAVQRMLAIQNRVRSLSNIELSDDWEEVRRRLLWAGGLRDLPNAVPGQGYTGHSFNDFNHCDLTAMVDEATSFENNGQVEYISARNPLGNCLKLLLQNPLHM